MGWGDNTTSEINEFKSKTADKEADKADFYRKTLENERATRELADKQVIDLLHNVRDRYDTKINSYMAKNKNNKNKQNNNNSSGNNKKNKNNKEEDNTNGNAWGDTNDNDNVNNTEADNWAEANNDTANNNSTDNWGDDNQGTSNDQNKDSGAWGSNNNDNQNEEWGVTTNDKNDTDAGWGQDTKPVGWGDENQTSPKKKDDNKNKKSPDKNKSPSAKSDNSGSNKKENKASKNETTPPNKKGGNQDKNKNSPNAKQDPKEKDAKEQKESANKVDVNSKEYLDMKSQLWTAKLDLRLSDRDKTKLAEQVAAVEKERDTLLRRLEVSKSEQDTLKMKVRGLTVDLCSAKEEIDKLNERIDEMEQLRRGRDRFTSSSETKRRSIEDENRTYRQQIAALENELLECQQEKQEVEKTFEDLRRRNTRLEADLTHSKNLIRTLKDGCAFVESQAKTFEVRHDTVVMSKADLERELINIKEESSRHITTINRLQKSNEKLSQAFIQSAEAHDQTRHELEVVQRDTARRLMKMKEENDKLVVQNNQLNKLIDLINKKKR